MNFCRNLSFLLIGLFFTVGFAQINVSKKLILIDPGHGGFDSGAIGTNGSFEKDIVLKIARKIISLNQTLFKDQFDFYLTRYDDIFIPLSKRSKPAEALVADLFISLHCNASSSVSRGIEVFVAPSGYSNADFQKKSMLLANAIIFQANHHLGIADRGIRPGDFQVLRETVAFCPAILVEMGFISNPDEAAYLSDDSGIRAVALAVLMGIHDLYD